MMTTLTPCWNSSTKKKMASTVSWKLGTWDTPAYSRKGSWRPEGGRGAHHHHHQPTSQCTSTTFLSTIGDEGLYNSCDKSLKNVLLWVLTLSWVSKSYFIFARVFIKLLFSHKLCKLENRGIYELMIVAMQIKHFAYHLPFRSMLMSSILASWPCQSLWGHIQSSLSKNPFRAVNLRSS